MDRRHFTGTMLAAGGGLALGPRGLWGAATPSPLAELRIDGPRLNRSLEALATSGGEWGGPNRRVAYSDADRVGREQLREWMEGVGLSTRVDAVGNLLGTLPGSVPGLPPLMMGSHIDSVPDGGHFDGPLGVLAAVEVVRRLREEGVTLRHPLEVANFANEVGGVMTGSRWPLERAWSRALSGFDHLSYRQRSTLSIRVGGDTLRPCGGRPGPGRSAMWSEGRGGEAASLRGLLTCDGSMSS